MNIITKGSYMELWFSLYSIGSDVRYPKTIAWVSPECSSTTIGTLQLGSIFQQGDRIKRNTTFRHSSVTGTYVPGFEKNIYTAHGTHLGCDVKYTLTDPGLLKPGASWVETAVATGYMFKSDWRYNKVISVAVVTSINQYSHEIVLSITDTKYWYNQLEDVKTYSHTYTLHEYACATDDPIKALKKKVASMDGYFYNLENRSKRYELCLSDLFRDACHSVNPLDTNNIANLQLIADLCKAIASRGKGIRNIVSDLPTLKGAKPTIRDITSAAGDSWLKYRYAYTTTKSDIILHINELPAAIKTLLGIFPPKYYSMREEQSDTPFGISKDSYKLQIHITANPTNAVQQLWMGANTLGLQVNLANIWDLIPFSFIADWFTNVGDTAAYLDDCANYNSVNYKFDDISASATRRIEFVPGLTYVFYDRVALEKPPVLFCDYEDHETSTTTIAKRVVDGVSLIVAK